MTSPASTVAPCAGRKVLLLGAGLVSPPVVRYLLERDVSLTIAANNPQRAAALIDGHPQGGVVAWEVEDRAALAELAVRHDAVISLLPATMHPAVAEVCLAQARHLVTTSYVSEALQGLDAQARAAGLVFLNELGVDPGIDHMSAMQVIDGVRRRGGRITSFRSYCGGLPAPDADDNPLRYKLSWNPLGVLRAALSSARYRDRGELREVPSEALFSDVHPIAVSDALRFEAYPNRDSMSYAPRYGIEDSETVYRGTLRWPGWAATMRALRALGLLSEDAPPAPASWAATLAAGAGLQAGSALHAQVAAHLAASRTAAGAALLDAAEVEQVVGRLDWLGVLDEAPLPAGAPSLLEALAAQMEALMRYAPGERDMLVMQHRFRAAFDDDGGREERIVATLVAYGEPEGDSAMARTVGLPVAIATRLVLEGLVDEPGVQIPVRPSLYEPILAELATLGIALEETRDG